MTTFKVYFICSAPKAVWALEEEIVIYSEVHLILLCNRQTRRGDTLYVGPFGSSGQERTSEQREMGRERARTHSYLLIGCNYKPFCLMDDKSFVMNELRCWKGRVNGIGLHILFKITVIMDLLWQKIKNKIIKKTYLQIIYWEYAECFLELHIDQLRFKGF